MQRLPQIAQHREQIFGHPGHRRRIWDTPADDRAEDTGGRLLLPAAASGPLDAKGQRSIRPPIRLPALLWVWIEGAVGKRHFSERMSGLA